MTDPCQQVGEIATLQANYDTLIGDVKEIKSDVKLLLEAKWKADGRSAVVGSIFGVLGALLIALVKGV